MSEEKPASSADVNVDGILDELSTLIGRDRADVRCEVYKGATQFYLRFTGIARVLSNEDLKGLLALSEKTDATLYVGEIPETSKDRMGVEVTLGVGPVLVTRTTRDPIR